MNEANVRKIGNCQPANLRVGAFLHTSHCKKYCAQKRCIMWWAIKRGNESLLGLSHEKPSSEMTEARTTLLSDVNGASLSRPE